MDLNRVLAILRDQTTNIDLYFTEKCHDRYNTMVAGIADNADGAQLKNIMKDLVDRNVTAINADGLEEVAYNPTGYREGTVESVTDDYIRESYNEVIESFKNPENEGLEDSADNLTFYTMLFTHDNDVVRIMRRVSKFKRFYSKGIIAAFHGNELNRIQDKMIGLDGSVDIIDYDGEVLILNHIALERIFRLDEKFESSARTILNSLRNNQKIGNFDSLEEDCLNDKRMQRTLTKMADEGIDWQHCLDHFENVVNIIDTFELEIDVIQTPEQMLMYEDKSQLMAFIRLIRDAYYKTMINERNGIDQHIG